MLDILGRWNRWGSASLPAGRTREVTAKLDAFLDTREIVTLVGPRRAGKSTVLFQVMDRLAARGIPDAAMLHLNLEEPALSVDQLTADSGAALLERAYETWRNEVHPAGRGWLFLDEVQRVPGWERWVRARNESESVKIFVTGSSSALLSRELGTLLTGRHVSFEVQPLSFGEYLSFRGVEVPPAVGTPPTMQHAVLQYLRWGGFPEVVLAEDDARRTRLLQQYFEDLLFKDVALRHQVRDLPLLRALATHLLTCTASLVSYQRLASIFGVSVEMIRTYCSHLMEAWLVELLPYYSLKLSERLRNPQKVHAVDTGLRNAIAISGGEDRGRLAESAVASAVRSLHAGTSYYWRGEREVDLVVQHGIDVRALVQVVWEGRKQIEEGRRAFPGATASVVSGSGAQGTLPLWRVLLDPALVVP